MRIVHERPPIFDEVVARFPRAAGPGVVFAYGDAIFNPSGVRIAPEIRAHEAAHLARQPAAGGAKAWWHRYLDDAEFRLVEEIIGHRAEYAEACRLIPNREARVRVGFLIAARLSGPLYGGMITHRAAVAAITG